MIRGLAHDPLVRAGGVFAFWTVGMFAALTAALVVPIHVWRRWR